MSRRRPKPYAPSLQYLPIKPMNPSSSPSQDKLTLDVGGWRFSIYQDLSDTTNYPAERDAALVHWARRIGFRR
jgi:hypothetical protein